MIDAQVILSFRHVCMTYFSVQDETQALLDVSFDVHSGEFVAVIGPSGCGKSTVLSLAAGLMPPASGEVRLSPDRAPRSAICCKATIFSPGGRSKKTRFCRLRFRANAPNKRSSASEVFLRSTGFPHLQKNTRGSCPAGCGSAPR